MKTRQQIFDIVATHLITQNAKSTAAGGKACLYRSPDGLMCAAGALIPEDIELDEEGNGAAFDDLSSDIREACGVYDEDIGFVGQLQFLHDVRPPTVWRDSLRNFATGHCLSTAALDAAIAARDSKVTP